MVACSLAPEIAFGMTALTESALSLIANNERLTAVRDAQLIDTPPEEGFDRLTRLAARALRVPVAFMVLVDEDRQFFKSAVGVPEPWSSTREAPLSHGYGAETVGGREPLVIRDARSDPRATGHQLVTDFGMLAYAGVPLLNADGQPIGAFAVMDREPRNWTTEELDTLSDVAAAARVELELRGMTWRVAEAAERARFLASAGEVLASSLDYRATLSQVAHLAVPALADYCVVDTREDDGTLRRVEAVHADPEKQPILDELRRWPAGPSRPADPVVRALETGHPVLTSEVTPEWLAATAPSPEQQRLLARLGVTSSMIVPLTARGRTIGTLAFGVTALARRFNADDLALAEELARRAALAVDNARLYERARQAAALREELVAVVAHDLKNPLSVIQMGATFVLEDLLPPAPDTDAARQQVEVIQRTAERMQRLVHDLLDASALEAGRLVVDPKPERADTLLREAAEAVEALARAKSVDLKVDVPNDSLQVLADRERVLQVFSNLCGNAIKFTPPGGEVRIAVRPSEEPGRVAFSVSDNGPGIAPEDQPHVFERFWKGKAAPGTGTGLGLTIAKGIVEAHGGRIRLVSTPGAGTTFSFTLPTAAPAASGERRRRV